ncbi:MAG: methyltransferase [Hyphomonadaceae bacterium]
MNEPSDMCGVTEDFLLGGKLCLYQPEQGFRASTDSILLGAALAHLTRIETGLELGCGVGGALFPAAFHLPDTKFSAIEADAEAVDLAQRGIEQNSWTERIDLRKGNIQALVPALENRFDLVFSNPPFFEASRTTPPGFGKTDAYLESLPLDGWLKAMLFAAKPKAHVVLIHRAAELARILQRLDKQGGEIRVLPIRPHPGSEASRILVSARKGLKRGRVRLLSGLDLHTSKGGDLTSRAAEIMNGAPLEWV